VNEFDFGPLRFWILDFRFWIVAATTPRVLTKSVLKSECLKTGRALAPFLRIQNRKSKIQNKKGVDDGLATGD
jgi:hypothetical protein